MGVPARLIDYDPQRHFKMEFTVPQTKFIRCAATYPLFVGGYGSGKSTTLAACVIRDFFGFPGANIACYAPTFDLLSLITVPYIAEILEGMGAKYRWIGGTKNMFIVEGFGNIICRSLNNPARIVGYEVFRSHIDELDTLPQKKAEDAWNKVVARNRQKIRRVVDGQFVLRADWKEQKAANKEIYILEENRVSAYTTPEGFMFCYSRWEKNRVDGYELVRAPTYSNPHLPDSYIPNLRSTYPAELIDAYIEGLFVNLTSGSVYKQFDRKLNHSDEVVLPTDVLLIGMDFNVMVGASVAHVLRDGWPVAVDEVHHAFDTDVQIAAWNQKYPNNAKIVYPDATGDHRTSSNTTASDIAKLKAAKWQVKVHTINPPIKNRVASFNGLICSASGDRRYKVNTKKCPELTSSLEQQVYDVNGMPDKSAGLDHIVDAPGYYVEYEFGLVKPKSTLTVIHGGY
jgi:hypothetical protein